MRMEVNIYRIKKSTSKLSIYLFVCEQQADEHCILLNPQHLSDVHGAPPIKEVVEEEREEDADGEEQVEAGELDQVGHGDAAR